MFSEACVSHSVHRRGGLCHFLSGPMLLLGVSVPGPMLLLGVSVPGPMLLLGVSLFRGGLCLEPSLSRGDLCPRGSLGVSVQGRGFYLGGVSVKGMAVGRTTRIRKAGGTHPTGMLSCFF